MERVAASGWSKNEKNDWTKWRNRWKKGVSLSKVNVKQTENNDGK